MLFPPFEDEETNVPPTVEEVRALLDEMVAEGELVEIEEINPATGKLEKRYHLAKHSLKPN